jgi:hypothetical protein
MGLLLFGNCVRVVAELLEDGDTDTGLVAVREDTSDVLCLSGLFVELVAPGWEYLISGYGVWFGFFKNCHRGKVERVMTKLEYIGLKH